ncbi:MAG: DUF1080 domain-containing protein [Planctomycetes bacterium]|nr:DUF1080 domain-containing protein [Planctomycetota bacterium]
MRCTFVKLTIPFVCLLVAFSSANPARAEALKIGDGSGWTFVNSRWTDGDAGITGSRTGDGEGLQGYCLAFARARSYSDVEATCTVQMKSGHADIGFIVRAQDPTRYYLIHFPQSGQSYRAQHFWAALSIADGSGYLRIKELAHVRRVASNPFGIAHQARVKVTGDRIQVWVNGHPALDVRDETYKQGRIGLAGFTSFAHGKVVVTGTEVKAGAWDDKVRQVKNWFVPFPDAGPRQGTPISLTRAPNGDLLCAFTADGKHKLGRSTDGGKNWSVVPAPANMGREIYLLKDGRLVSIEVRHGEGSWSESKDNGTTWGKVVPITPSGAWPKDPAKIGTGWQLALKDGTLVRFGLGRHSTWSEPVTKWGAVHTQAFAIRSTDGGKTWSTPVNLDASGRGDMGNLDLTEPVGFETKDGKIMCLIRPIYSPWMWETWSSDQGKTWTPCVRGPFPGYAPSAPVKTASGVVLFPTRFPGLALHHTRDDGMTWDEGGGGTYIDTSIWAMGSLVEVRPNVVLFLYMDSWQDKLRAQFIRVTEKGLEPVRP